MKASRIILAAAAVLALAASGAMAQSVDDALGGFGSGGTAPPPKKGGAGKPAGGASGSGPVRFGGGISQDLVWNYAHDAPLPGRTDHRGLSGFRTKADAELDITLNANWRGRITGYAFYDSAYEIQGRGGYTPEFLDANESEAVIGDFYLQGKLRRNLDLRIGRQVVAWGKADSIRVTDILNPLDMREPGRTDIADTRLPVTMTKLDYYLGKWNASFMVLHELRYTKVPVHGSDFFPGMAPLPADDPETGFDLGTQQYAVALNGNFTGWDLSIYGASVIGDNARFSVTPQGPRLTRDRVLMLGVSANVVRGSWLVKGEAAWFDGLQFAAIPGTEFSRLDIMVGVEYSGIADTSIAFEAGGRRILDYDARIGGLPDLQDEDEGETALRVSRKFLNDTLTVGLVISTFWPEGGSGGFQRLQATYDLTDAIEVSGGVINFDSANTPALAHIGNNDRVFARARYRF